MPETPRADVDYGELTDADMAMLRHAMSAGADEVDFTRHYADAEEEG